MYLDYMETKGWEHNIKTGGTYLIKDSARNIDSARYYIIMKLLLRLGIQSRYCFVPKSEDISKVFKYSRDISNGNNERGLINCSPHETKTFCDCMKPKKHQAKKYGKKS